LLRIKVAKDIGFCFGVDKAVEIAKDLLDKGEDVYVTGELIHNEEEMKKLNQLGLKTFDVTSKWPDLSEATVLIRAHGVPVDQLEKIKMHAKKVVDATCPVVLSLSESILDAKKQGFEVLLYGHDKHDEVVFLKSVVNDLKVFDSPESLRYSTKKIALFSQTTMDAERNFKSNSR
jgi:4-hydroxy-3-methylbut-2-enyl diphosphate reductase